MSEPVDFTQANYGALPSLNDEAVLGVPESKSKSKTNVGKFAILGFVLAGLLFILAGLLIYQKNKKGSSAEAQKTAQKPGYAAKNEALESDSIERAKAELKKKDEEEKARLKAIEEAQAEARRRAEAEEAAARKTRQPNMAGQGSSAQPAGPQPLTPTERKMASAVLLDNTGAKPKADAPQISEKDAQQREVQARMTAMGLQPGQPGQPSPLGGGGGGAAQGGESLASRLQPTALQARTAGKLPNLDYLLKKGTTVPCALKTGIDTSLPGFVLCNVLNDVYSANGKTILIERGATVFGEQQTALKQGQARTFVVWTRIDNPTGVFANIDSPATDQMGYSGIPGYVDTHFWQRFGGAILMSLIKDFSQAYSQRLARSGNSGAAGTMMMPQYQNMQQASQDMASEALRNSINIPPALYVNPGTVVNVLVARDVSFENVYALVE